MNDWLVVDANVIVKAFVAEAGSEAAGVLWSSDALLVAPAHALAEVGEVLRRKRKQSEIDEDQWTEIYSALPRSFLAIGLENLFERAMEISDEVSQSFYDCLYVAAAERWDTSFITADERFVRAALGTRFQPRVLSLKEYTGT